jgi:D-alanyl-D-alanine carboxypeptidase
MGGRSGGSRDAIMRNLLAENLEKAANRRTVAAITERNGSNANTEIAQATDDDSQPASPAQPSPAAVQVASAASEPVAAPAARSNGSASRSIFAAATAAVPAAKTEPAPLTNGVLQAQALAAIPGSSEPMKPVKVKTVHVKAGTTKLASAGPSQSTPAIVASAPQPIVPETSSAVVAKAAEVARPEPVKSEPNRLEAARAEMPPQPPGHGSGNGLLGVLPAATASAAQAPPPQSIAVASAGPQALPPSAAMKVHTGWIVQVGALETEAEAQARIDAARNSSRGLLTRADSFTEPVIAKDNRKLFRARFAGLERDQAEAVCRTLRRSDIACMAVRN